MKTSSCKAKGRRCAQEVALLLLAWGKTVDSTLTEADFIVTSSGDTGEDIKLSTAARALFPISIECKNVERLNIWNAIDQAKGHASRTGNIPMVAFKRNRSDIHVTVNLIDFLHLILKHG